MFSCQFGGWEIAQQMALRYGYHWGDIQWFYQEFHVAFVPSIYSVN